MGTYNARSLFSDVVKTGIPPDQPEKIWKVGIGQLLFEWKYKFCQRFQLLVVILEFHSCTSHWR